MSTDRYKNKGLELCLLQDHRVDDYYSLSNSPFKTVVMCKGPGDCTSFNVD